MSGNASSQAAARTPHRCGRRRRARHAVAAWLGLAAVGAVAHPAGADPIYASQLVSAQNTRSFLGGNVLGAPDRSGLFLGSTVDPAAALGTLVVRFATGFFDGAGPDLWIIDVDRDATHAAESAEVDVSRDGSQWTPLGSVLGGTAQGQLDIGGQLREPLFFVRIRQTTSTALDVDAVRANYTVPIPEPATLALLAAGVAGLAAAGARRH